MSDAGWTALTAIAVNVVGAAVVVLKEWIQAAYAVNVVRSERLNGAKPPQGPAQANGGPPPK